MKIFIISEMTLYSQLKELCKKNSFQIEKKLALKMVPSKYDITELDSMIYSADGLIFQSKSAVNYCKNNHTTIKKRNELDNKEKRITNRLEIYCIGKYSAEEIKRLVNVNSNYNTKDFSSEGLLEAIKGNCKSGDTFIIIKGIGGRDYIEEELIKNNIFVKSYYVYERTIANFSIHYDDLVTGNNYFLVSSLIALETIQNKLEKNTSKKIKVAVVPTERIAAQINNSIFDDYIIINNMSTARQYIDEIEKYEKK